MIFAQIDTALKVGADYGIVAFLLIGGAAFVGSTLLWIAKQTVGADGYLRKSSERNSETMEKFGETLVELTNLNRSQQELCSAHAGSMKLLERFSETMIELHTDPQSTFSTVGLREKMDSLDAAVVIAADDRKKIIEQVNEHTGYHENMHNTWGEVNPMEFRVPPVLDAMMHTIETAEGLASKCGCDCTTELRDLRKKIEDVKSKMEGGEK